MSATFPPEMELKFEKVVVMLLYLRYNGMSFDAEAATFTKKNSLSLA